VNQYWNGKTSLDLLEQETVSGSGIRWAICKCAPRPKQITMPAVFYRLDVLPAAQPTEVKSLQHHRCKVKFFYQLSRRKQFTIVDVAKISRLIISH